MCIASRCRIQRHDMLQHAATRCNTLQHTATHCSTLQHTATHCNTLQHPATRCRSKSHHPSILPRRLQPHCNTMQHTATHCNTLQHTATHYTHPAGARVIIQAFCRGDHSTSPIVKTMFHKIAEVTFFFFTHFFHIFFSHIWRYESVNVDRFIYNFIFTYMEIVEEPVAY